MVAWRAAGLNYVRFSQIAAQITTKCLKAGTTKNVKGAATLKTTLWENGKAVAKSA